MKLITFLLMATLSQVTAIGYSQKISLDERNISVEVALKAIEKQTDYLFLYDNLDLSNSHKVTVSIKNATIDQTLMQLFQGMQLSYKIFGKSIVIKKEIRKKEETLAPPIEAPLLEQVIKGRVTDGTGGPLPGVSILVKGTQRGTTTDLDGIYQITVSENESNLVFSYVGYLPQDIAFGSRTTLDVVLKVDEKALDEVVVTAFGIEKSKKELVYSTQEIKGEAVASSGSSNMLSGLQGKIAGVTVNLNSGMPGKSPDIRIRGYRSLTGNNAPLYIVDGMPVSGGGRQMDFNPADIETMNVLKGPAASALYGLRAANGVIIITTKNGKESKGKPVITFDTHYNADQVTFLSKPQKEFAQGLDGKFDASSIYAWGPRISSMTAYTNQLGQQEQPAVYDNQKAFYQTGGTLNTNLSFAAGNETGNFLIGLGHTYQKGIVPGSDMKRINIKVNGELKVAKNFTVNTAFNYSDLGITDFPEVFGNDNFFRGLIETPPSYDLAGKAYAFSDNPYRQIFYRAGQNNPYWVINNNFREQKTQRTFGNVFFKYDFTKNLSLNYRVGLDHYATDNTVHRELGDGPTGRTNPPAGGSLSLTNSNANQLNSNLFLSFNKKFREVFDVNAIVGNEIFDNKSNANNVTGSNYLVGGWANLANTTVIQGSNQVSKNRIVGFYGNVNIGWKDMLFLNASARNDVVSNMPSSKRSFLYPSIGAGFILTEALPHLQKVMSFAKLRATYAEVGQAGPLFVNDRGFRSYNPSGFTFPFQGLGSWTQNTTRISPTLKPENTKSYELGFDLRFLNDRISLDYTYYRNMSVGQIFNVPIPVTTGATSEIRNAGELLSFGHEIMLSLALIQSADFDWNFMTNFSRFDNRVKALYGETDRVVITAGDGFSLVAERGEKFPSFLGRSFLRDPATNQMVIQSSSAITSNYGLPIIQTVPKILGTPNPDFEFNFINNLKYKTFSLSFQVDWRKGGQLFSQSLTESIRRGLAPETLERENQVVLAGKKGTITNGNLVIEGDNDIGIKKDFRWGNIMYQITENILDDASFIRLREVSFSYDLPKQLTKKTLFNSASVFVTGRNLFLISDSFVDPELNTSEGFASSSNSVGIEWSQTPQTKSFGAGIRLRF